jgi:hypothetical protein
MANKKGAAGEPCALVEPAYDFRSVVLQAEEGPAPTMRRCQRITSIKAQLAKKAAPFLSSRTTHNFTES